MATAKTSTFSKAGMELEIRHLQEKDLDQMYEMCLSIGWTFVTRKELTELDELFPNARSGAFDKNNVLISTCSFFPVDEKTVYFTYYITRPEYQKKGIGKHLYEYCIKHQERPNVLLVASPEAEDIYRAWGYKMSVHSACEFIGKLRAPENQLLKNLPDPKLDYKIEPVQKHLQAVVKFEQEFVCAHDRTKIFEMVLNFDQLVVAQCVLLDGKVQGFIFVVRAPNNAMKTSAFQAKNVKIAQLLLRDITENWISPGTVFKARFSGANWDVCEKLYTEFGLSKSDALVYKGMYYGEDVEVQWQNVYSLLNYGISFQ